MQFLNLNVTPDIKRVFLPPMDEGVSKAISPPGGFKIFDKHVSTFYVSEKVYLCRHSWSNK